jgi:hypothetical protein
MGQISGCPLKIEEPDFGVFKDVAGRVMLSSTLDSSVGTRKG